MYKRRSYRGTNLETAAPKTAQHHHHHHQRCVSSFLIASLAMCMITMVIYTELPSACMHTIRIHLKLNAIL